MEIVTLSSKGQIVVPKTLREKAGLVKGTKLRIEMEGNRIILEPVSEKDGDKDWRKYRGILRGTRAVADHLEEHIQEVRKDEGGI